MGLRRFTGRRLWRGCLLALSPVLLTLLALEVYVLAVEHEGSLPLPPLVGNFPRVVSSLGAGPSAGAFTFAIVGDTKSMGTFERLWSELPKRRLAFGVLLGDCAYGGTEPDHRYLRAEWATELALPFPVFYVVGNHDVSEDRFPIPRFEETYGPSIFSFEYSGCLFVVLRTLKHPASNRQNVEFLRALIEKSPGKYRKRFVFMHMPPSVCGEFTGRKFDQEQEIMSLVRQMGADFVFAGDFHGYGQVQRNGVTYVVTGGGGAHLRQKIGGVHHAVLVTVSEDSVSQQLVAVPRSEEIEDRLERFAISEVSPWMRANMPAVVVLNAVGLVWIWLCATSVSGALRALRRHQRAC